MKHIILFLAIFGVLLANAQELDTTFVVNEQGQTVGIIHEKGTVPVVPQQQQPMPQQQQYQPELYQMEPTDNFDSAAYYQNLVERYTTSGNKLNGAGVGMMIGGGIASLVGLVMLVEGLQEDNCEEVYENNYECEGNAMDVGGSIILSLGAAVFTTGVVLKIIGGSKIRRANRYNEALTNYQNRRQYSMRLRFDPLIDPINKKAGANLALNF